MFMNVYVHGYVYVYDSICWALKCPVHCAEQFLELKICISPQFRAIRILREGSSSRMKMCVSLQRRACKSMEMYVSLQWRFATGGGPYHGGGGVATRDTEPYIYIYISGQIVISVESSVDDTHKSRSVTLIPLVFAAVKCIGLTCFTWCLKGLMT